jgi:hypothetical protein
MSKNLSPLTPCALLMFNFMIKFTLCFMMGKASQGGCICPVLGQPGGYSAAMAIETKGTNWAIGVLTGYGHVKILPVHYVVLC